MIVWVYFRAIQKSLKGQRLTKQLNKDLKNLSEMSINIEAKHIAKKLTLSDRIEHLVRNLAFTTLKDHRENFSSKLLYRLMIPSKSELGKKANKNWKTSTK